MKYTPLQRTWGAPMQMERLKFQPVLPGIRPFVDGIIENKAWLAAGWLPPFGGFHSQGGTPRAGWFTMVKRMI